MGLFEGLDVQILQALTRHDELLNTEYEYYLSNHSGVNKTHGYTYMYRKANKWDQFFHNLNIFSYILHILEGKNEHTDEH